jgi:hypothetical protein
VGEELLLLQLLLYQELLVLLLLHLHLLQLEQMLRLRWVQVIQSWCQARMAWNGMGGHYIPW